MDNKSQRLAEIKKIIQNEHVTSQEKLLKTLISKGFHITQATLSRDLKQLKVAKIPDNDGTYRYILNNTKPVESTTKTGSLSHFYEGVISVEFSGNMGVIKTIPAFAPTISSAIDKAGFEEIVGTVAGDDTVMIVLRENYTQSDVKQSMINIFPELINKLL